MTFTKVVLYTDTDGRARWREESIALDEGTPQALLSALFGASPDGLRVFLDLTVGNGHFNPEITLRICLKIAHLEGNPIWSIRAKADEVDRTG